MADSSPVPQSGGQPEYRIGDAEREVVVERLQAAFGEGRLDAGELEERLEIAYGAKTRSDLVALEADLPPVPMPAPPRQREPFLTPDVLPFLMPPMICTIIYLITNAGGYFWPVWVWLGCSVPLAFVLVGRRNR